MKNLALFGIVLGGLSTIAMGHADAIDRIISPNGSMEARHVQDLDEEVVMITRPRYLFEGKAFTVWAGDDESPALRGICRNFGYMTNAAHRRNPRDWRTSYGSIHIPDPTNIPVAFLNEDGSLQDIYEEPPVPGLYPVHWLRCRKL